MYIGIIFDRNSNNVTVIDFNGAFPAIFNISVWIQEMSGLYGFNNG